MNLDEALAHCQANKQRFKRILCTYAIAMLAITPMNQHYFGKDIILDLPATHDIYAIKWLSVYCVQFRVDFGHVKVEQINERIPPFVPLQKSQFDVTEELREPWPVNTLVGHPSTTTNFTVQLGTPGGRRAYESWAKARPSTFVFYVNGYMTPELVVQRGTKYNFIIQAGDGQMGGMEDSDYYNPFYLSDEPFGGFGKLDSDDRNKVHTYAGLDGDGQPIVGSDNAIGKGRESSTGRFCVYSPDDDQMNADHLDDFGTYFTHLRLKCGKGMNGLVSWTPDENTPDLVYYQSYTNYNMGFRVKVMDSIPDNMQSASYLPHDYQIWLDTNTLVKVPRSYNGVGSGYVTSVVQCGLITMISFVIGLYFVRC